MFKYVFKYNNNYKRILNIRTYKTDNVRVRFAPSPTGFLHLGGLRTALYNYLFARKYNGKFILRIEDTDQSRVVAGATEQLQDDLKWSGIEIDESPWQGGNFGPYLQSQRLQIYRKHVDILLTNGSAYHCFCTDKRLQLLRRESLRLQEVPKYDNRCRHLTADVARSRLEKGDISCIRFKVGNMQKQLFNIGDPVIIKSDGFPTYHFANVVDDHLMRITHVLRGVEWQISTTKHILLYRAFNWKPPLFGHLPLLMNVDGTKLSKRQGDIRVSHYKENHIFPLALINFIVQSGGGFTKDLERNIKPRCYSIEDLSNQNIPQGVSQNVNIINITHLSEQLNLIKELFHKTPIAITQLESGELSLPDVVDLFNSTVENLKSSGDFAQQSQHIKNIILKRNPDYVEVCKILNLLKSDGFACKECLQCYRYVPVTSCDVERSFSLLRDFDISRINSHSGKLMPERLLEFNRLELKRKLESEDEESELINRVIEILKTTFHERLSDNSLELSEDHIRNILHWSIDRIEKLSDLISKDFEFIWIQPTPQNIQICDINMVELLKKN
ncbi:hypothetical protein NQ314_010495 [Rhamnusium bicolor]|uniref:Nondiscriminating glutamyl-tRNA synthetase EARS2, mitochondrial n=1 Tax=Rhamnusium bicolor TaxID=1586634 RepID=A0AAV8XPX7_9CUCU|nr:hypothetical protein NQ314_010495 [Rhamnusium bicolor]